MWSAFNKSRIGSCGKKLPIEAPSSSRLASELTVGSINRDSGAFGLYQICPLISALFRFIVVHGVAASSPLRTSHHTLGLAPNCIGLHVAATVAHLAFLFRIDIAPCGSSGGSGFTGKAVLEGASSACCNGGDEAVRKDRNSEAERVGREHGNQKFIFGRGMNLASF
ncbi:hypothetical protein NL676_035308 [Syzygium grande]|nr:hypothetical protein NL676_035308 [Syzygium grande]